LNERGEQINTDVAIKHIVEEYQWKPADISGLFLDNWDYLGLYYWYEHIKEKRKHNK